MSRLTYNTRMTIQRLLLDHAFRAEKQALRIRLENAGTAVYEAVVPLADRRLLASLPNGWIEPTGELLVTHLQEFEYPSLALPLNERVPASLCEGYRVKVRSAALPIPLRESILELFLTSQRLEDRERAAHYEVGCALKGFNTWKQLLQAWPECEEVIKGIIPAAKSSKALATIPQQLNETLRLP